MNKLDKLKKIPTTLNPAGDNRISFGNLSPYEQEKILQDLAKINQEILDLPNLK